MKRTFLTTLASVAFVAAATLSGTASAAGENGHAYNGSYCGPYYGSQAGHFRNQVNGIYNLSNGGRYITCPVLVDEINDLDGTTRVWVNVNVPVGQPDARCTLYSLTGLGGLVQSQSNFGRNWIRIPAFTVPDNYWGNYNMVCYLPKGARLNTIWLGEG